VVTAEDGTTLQCLPHHTGGVLAPLQWRWRVIDPSGTSHIGPSINDDPDLAPLASRISAWWDARKELSLNRRGGGSVLHSAEPTHRDV
jgi:hypothetical protein